VPQDLGEGLILRRATVADTESLIALHAEVLHDPGEQEPDESVITWSRDLIERDHPTFEVGDFTVVEDTRSGAIVSSLCRASCAIMGVDQTPHRKQEAPIMTHHRLSLPVSVVKQYTLDVIRRKMPVTQLRIAGQHTTPFPKHRSRLKSFYEYRPRSLSRDRRGRLRGGVVRLVGLSSTSSFTPLSRSCGKRASSVAVR
jgi:hypothetical protein